MGCLFVCWPGKRAVLPQEVFSGPSVERWERAQKVSEKPVTGVWVIRNSSEISRERLEARQSLIMRLESVSAFKKSPCLKRERIK